jgi:hypothetical protein
MTRRLAPVVVLVCAALAIAARPAGTNDPDTITVHEWGTFTSIAGEDGTAVPWMPLQGPQDLPCFVERVRIGIKPDLAGTIRMETPVLYFYGAQDSTVNVRVRFRKGLVTEWFPRAAVSPDVVNPNTLMNPALESSITWKRVRILPRSAETFPTDPHESHYYAARATDAAPLQVGEQREKFLFYRGVGRFQPPITAALESDRAVAVRNPDGEALGDVILFENHRGDISYARATIAASHGRLSIKDRRGRTSVEALGRDLERILVARGLYRKEAAAMVATWRDSWFEEGTRLFYVAPPKTIDDVLPLEMTPTPAAIARVFVGRVELITPRVMQDVRQALLAADRAALVRYGRFLDPIAGRVIAAADPASVPALKTGLQEAYGAYFQSRRPEGSCK